MVSTMMGSDWAPVWSTTRKSRPKPRSTTAAWSSFFEVNETPASRPPRSFRKSATTMPATMESTGPPTTGTAVPTIQQGMEMARQRRMPLPFSLTN